MNILVICHEFPPVGGGTGNAAMHIGRELAKNHAVTVLTSSGLRLPRREEKDGLTIVRTSGLRRRIYGMSPLELLIFTLSAIPSAIKLHRQKHIDGCLAFHGVPAAWVSLALWKFCRVPYVVSLRGVDVPGFLPKRFDRLHQLVIRLTRLSWHNARRVVANSQGLKDLAERTALPIGVEVDVIPNGVDLEFYRPAASKKITPVRKALFAGRITEQKGLIYLLEALGGRTMEFQSRLGVEIVGDGDLKISLERLAQKLGLDSIVSFYPRLSREELLKKYQSSCFFILPSLAEGMSNVILEAMACGLPVAATAIDANAELVREGINGFLFPPRDAAALGRLLARIAQMDEEQLSAMGRTSRECVKDLSWVKAAEAYRACFTEEVKRENCA
jgi:glycosyltransferase involved in cell wall biosynthesis